MPKKIICFVHAFPTHYSIAIISPGNPVLWPAVNVSLQNPVSWPVQVEPMVLERASMCHQELHYLTLVVDRAGRCPMLATGALFCIVAGCGIPTAPTA